MKECECPEEGTRNVVAECLGKLTLINPAQLLPKLKQHLTSKSALTRATVVTAVKFTISDQVTYTDLVIFATEGTLARARIVNLVKFTIPKIQLTLGAL